jgi:hypothetical protein
LRAPATILTDSQGLLAAPLEAFLLSGKVLRKKSLFPYQSQAIRCRRVHQVLCASIICAYQKFPFSGFHQCHIVRVGLKTCHNINSPGTAYLLFMALAGLAINAI